jgi:phosphoribosylformylglycinamidine synthase
MLSESQERMLVVARPGRERDVERVFGRWELHGVLIGETTHDQALEIISEGRTVASLAPHWLADDAPEYDVTAWAKEPEEPGQRGQAAGPLGGAATGKIGLELLELLASPALASRRVLYRTFDQMVGTDTVVTPGYGDAGVMRIKGRSDGIAVAIDAQPRVAAIDPFVGAAAAVAEATRNVVCAGATPLAITDCLNMGNPERPTGAWQLERSVAGIKSACDALAIPVVSGNVSLYNATRGVDIWPTAIIGAVGHLDDAAKHIPVTSGAPGDVVLLAGNANVALGASAYGANVGVHEGPVSIDLALEARLQKFVLDAHARGLIRAAHDRAEGGLGVALAELALRDGVGMKVTLPAVRGIDKRVALFGEAPSGIVLVVAAKDADVVRSLAGERDVPVWTLGTIGGDLLEIAPVLGMPIASLREAHEHGLARALGREA